MTVRLQFDVSVYYADQPFPRHRHEELQLSLILRGGVSETVGPCAEIGRALSVVSKDSGLFHADQFHHEGAKIARLSMQRSIMNDLLEPDRRVDDWRWTHDPRVARPFLSLVRRAKVDSLRFFDVDDADVTDLFAAFSARPVTTEPGSPPAWLREVMTELRESWNAAITVGDVARRAGVHQVYLARCIRRWYGTTLGDELRRLRLAASVAMLTNGRSSVASIAHRTGYSDEPHLCRTTRDLLGLTPRRLRSLVADVA
jgi:AraC-like DNA-binding protein